MCRQGLAFWVGAEVLEGLLGSKTRLRWLLGSIPLSPSCTFGNTLGKVRGYGTEVKMILRRVCQAWGVGYVSFGQSEQTGPDGSRWPLWKEEWAPGGQILRLPEKLAARHSSGLKVLAPSRCTYLNIPVLSGCHLHTTVKCANLECLS